MEIAAGYVNVAMQHTVFPRWLDPQSIPALYATYWFLLVAGAYLFYLSCASLSYAFFFRWKADKFFPPTIRGNLNKQIRTEIYIALSSLPLMGLLMAPFPVLVHLGYSRVYKNVDDYGWTYVVFCVPLFLFVSDMMIYFIHRGLHLPWLYQHVHKPHHTYQYTTPFSSHAFHPVDGWAQGVPYYLFCFVFPMHHYLFVALFVLVNMWTVSIHDQVDFFGAGILNSTGHHTLHHALFRYNYGQYFTLWDRICRTYKPAAKTNALLTGERVPLPSKFILPPNVTAEMESDSKHQQQTDKQWKHQEDHRSLKAE